MPMKTLPAASLPYDCCPPRLKRIHFRDLDVGTVSENYYVKGWIRKRFPLITGRTTLVKVVLEEDDAGSSIADGQTINVFIFGHLALESDKALSEGNMVALSGFLVDKSPSASKDGRLHLQLELSDDDGSCIWTSSPPTSSARPTNNADVSSPPTKQRANMTVASYTYININEIREGLRVNLYAIVKFFRPPKSTHGKDHLMILTLVDQSESERGLRCVLFGQPDQLPKVTCVGDIIRMHRLKIQLHQGILQGTNSPGFTALVFSGQIGAPLTPSSTTSNYHFDQDVDHKFVLALRQWVSRHFVSPSSGVCFSDIKPPQFLDVRCQLVAKAVVDHRTTFLKVWDGTRCPYPMHHFPIDDAVLLSKSGLLHRSQGLAVDIAAYDDHAKTTRNLQLGSFLKIFNLHASLRQDKLEIVLHGGGTNYGRAIVTLPSDSPELISLCRAMEKVNEETGDDLVTEALPAAADDRNESNLATKEGQGVASEDLTRTQETISCDATEPRCLQSSATARWKCGKYRRRSLLCVHLPHGAHSAVPTARHHIKPVFLSTVLAAPVLNKHHIRARLIDYSPELLCRGIRLHCPECNTLRDIPSQKAISSALKGLATWPVDPEVQRSKDQKSTLRNRCSEADPTALEDGWFFREKPFFRLVPCNGRMDTKKSALLVEGTAVTELENLSDNVGCVIPVALRDGILTWPDYPVPFVIKKRHSYYRCLCCSQPRGRSFRVLEQLKSFDVNKVAEALGIQPMRYIFTLRFCLLDSTGDIVASLAADEAEIFFRGIRAEDVHVDEGLQNHLVDLLHKLCANKDTENHPMDRVLPEGILQREPGSQAARKLSYLQLDTGRR